MFYRSKTIKSQKAFKKQRNYVSKLYKKERKKYYANLNLNEITDNKKFWKTIKSLFSENGPKNQKITIVKDNEIISEDKEVAETLNSFFQGAVDSLEITENEYLKNLLLAWIILLTLLLKSSNVIQVY